MAGNRITSILEVITRGGKQAIDSFKQVASSANEASTATNKLNAANQTYHSGAKALYQTNLAQGRAISKLKNDIGGSSGLVAAYATLAVNLYAASAALTTLSNAAQLEQLVKSLNFIGNAAGTNLGNLVNRLRDVTGEAISTEQALRSASLGVSAGFSSDQLVNLAKVARGASLALGRDMSDAMDRLTRGAAKLEPEILDELGIIVRLDTATASYAAQVGKAVDQLSQYERTQAFINAINEQGAAKFGAVAEAIDPNPYDQLVAALSDLQKQALNGINSFLEFTGVIKGLTTNTPALIGAIVLFASTISRSLLPALYAMPLAASKAAIRLAKLSEIKLKADFTEFTKLPPTLSKLSPAFAAGTATAADFAKGIASADRSIAGANKRLEKYKQDLALLNITEQEYADKVAHTTQTLNRSTAARQSLIEYQSSQKLASINTSVANGLELASNLQIFNSLKELNNARKQNSARLAELNKGATLGTRALNLLGAAGFAAGIGIRFLGTAFVAALPYLGVLLTFGPLLYDFVKGLFPDSELNRIKDSVAKTTKEVIEELNRFKEVDQQFGINFSNSFQTDKLIGAYKALAGIASTVTEQLEKSLTAGSQETYTQIAEQQRLIAQAEAKIRKDQSIGQNEEISRSALLFSNQRATIFEARKEINKLNDALVDAQKTAATEVINEAIGRLSGLDALKDSTVALEKYRGRLVNVVSNVKDKYELQIEVKKASDDLNLLYNSIAAIKPALGEIEKAQNDLFQKQKSPIDDILNRYKELDINLQNIKKSGEGGLNIISDEEAQKVLKSFEPEILAITKLNKEAKEGAKTVDELVKAYVKALQGARDATLAIDVLIKSQQSIQKELAGMVSTFVGLRDIELQMSSSILDLEIDKLTAIKNIAQTDQERANLSLEIASLERQQVSDGERQLLVRKENLVYAQKDLEISKIQNDIVLQRIKNEQNLSSLTSTSTNQVGNALNLINKEFELREKYLEQEQNVAKDRLRIENEITGFRLKAIEVEIGVQKTEYKALHKTRVAQEVALSKVQSDILAKRKELTAAMAAEGIYRSDVEKANIERLQQDINRLESSATVLNDSLNKSLSVSSLEQIINSLNEYYTDTDTFTKALEASYRKEIGYLDQKYDAQRLSLQTQRTQALLAVQQSKLEQTYQAILDQGASNSVDFLELKISKQNEANKLTADSLALDIASTQQRLDAATGDNRIEVQKQLKVLLTQEAIARSNIVSEEEKSLLLRQTGFKNQEEVNRLINEENSTVMQVYKNRLAIENLRKGIGADLTVSQELAVAEQEYSLRLQNINAEAQLAEDRLAVETRINTLRLQAFQLELQALAKQDPSQAGDISAMVADTQALINASESTLATQVGLLRRSSEITRQQAEAELTAQKIALASGNMVDIPTIDLPGFVNLALNMREVNDAAAAARIQTELLSKDLNTMRSVELGVSLDTSTLYNQLSKDIFVSRDLAPQITVTPTLVTEDAVVPPVELKLPQTIDMPLTLLPHVAVSPIDALASILEPTLSLLRVTQEVTTPVTITVDTIIPEIEAVESLLSQDLIKLSQEQNVVTPINLSPHIVVGQFKSLQELLAPVFAVLLESQKVISPVSVTIEPTIQPIKNVQSLFFDVLRSLEIVHSVTSLIHVDPKVQIAYVPSATILLKDIIENLTQPHFLVTNITLGPKVHVGALPNMEIPLSTALKPLEEVQTVKLPVELIPTVGIAPLSPISADALTSTLEFLGSAKTVTVPITLVPEVVAGGLTQNSIELLAPVMESLQQIIVLSTAIEIAPKLHLATFDAVAEIGTLIDPILNIIKDHSHTTLPFNVHIVPELALKDEELEAKLLRAVTSLIDRVKEGTSIDSPIKINPILNTSYTRDKFTEEVLGKINLPETLTASLELILNISVNTSSLQEVLNKIKSEVEKPITAQVPIRPSTVTSSGSSMSPTVENAKPEEPRRVVEPPVTPQINTNSDNLQQLVGRALERGPILPEIEASIAATPAVVPPVEVPEPNINWTSAAANIQKFTGEATSRMAPFIQQLKNLGPEGQLVAAIGSGTLTIGKSFASIADGMGQIGEAGASVQTKLEGTSQILGGLSNAIGAIGAIQQASSAQRVAEIDREIEAEKKRDGKSKESVARIAALERKKEQEKKKAFETNKKIMMAQAIMSTAAAIAGALGAPPFGPWNIAMAAIVGAMGAAQVAVISGMSYQGGGASSASSLPSSISVGERSNKVDLAQRPTGGELAYIQGARGMGTTANDFKPAFMGAQYRATGGYVVGEQGPELFVPETPGKIIPSEEARAMGQPINVSFSVSAIDATNFNEMLMDQRGNIISMIREAANSYGEPFLQTVDTIPMAPTRDVYYRKA